MCSIRTHSQQYKAKGTTFNLLHSQDNSRWKGLLEVSSPPSKQGSLEVRPESKDILERSRTSLDPTRLFPLLVKEIL